jgi:predicted P-loop ATPase
LSTSSQLRFGSKGSLAIEIAGPDRGLWFDHEQGVGGDGLALVAREKRVANGAACDWAREWLGLDRSDGTHIKQKPGASPPGGTSQGKAAKVARIVADCQDPHGTPADAYLKGRGITKRPLPPSLCYRLDAFGRYGALVALATDDAGTINAIQQICLTADGQKAPVRVQKRTNKARDGWAETSSVRLPGEPPIVLSEGVETGLSIWQATGQAGQVCLGIANFGHAPLPGGCQVVVARDGDRPGTKADRQIHRAVGVLMGRGHEVAIAEPPPGKDFNDVLQEEGEDAVRALIKSARPADGLVGTWRAELLYTDEGEPRAVLANAIHALRQAPEWQGVLWHNEFSTSTVCRRQPPWTRGAADWEDIPWSDRDDYLATDWLQRHNILVPASIAGQAVETVARDRLFHPVREYLTSITWDGWPRLDRWLMVYLGVADTPYARAIGARWLISAVARIFKPGAKVDCVLILEGPQGIKKSTALRVLADPWFTDRLSDLGSKDAAMETRGVWIIEIAELDTMSRAEAGAVKAFMSRAHDRFRPPYGKRLVDLPRQCVFAGSVNPEGGYLKDATGGRRFWPVLCTAIDIERLAADRDQLWAEARVRFAAGEPWWLDTLELNAAATQEQEDRYQGDAWEAPIRHYLEQEVQWNENGYGERKAYSMRRGQPLSDISVPEILEHALGIEKGRWSQVDQNRVARCLVSMGFVRYRPRRDGERERRYRLKVEHPPTCGPGGPGRR